MKRFIFLVLFTNLLFVQYLYATKSIWDGRSSDTSWYDENSSEYHINSAAQFKGFADLVSYNYCSFEAKTVYLDCDIDLDNQPWSPIGLHSSKEFAGSFDGQNHMISNMFIDTDQQGYPDMKDNFGLFGYAHNADIRNVKVQGIINVGSNGKYIGGVASSANHIDNIYSDIIINLLNSKSSSYIGTVAGMVEDAEKIYSRGEIKFYNSYDGFYDGCYVGGIFGRCTEIRECDSEIDITVNRVGQSSGYIGGITGASGKITDVIFTGSIEVNNINLTTDVFMVNAGGICGSFYDGEGNYIISAPNYLSLGRGWAIGRSIIVPSSSTATFSNTYYVNTWATSNEVYGIAISESDLKSGTPLSGFDTNKWEFNANEYPSIISLKSLMPAPTYTVEYYVDGVLYQIDEYKDGDTVIPPADPTKEGYTFDGWGYIPPFISGNSWIVYGTFSINSYVIKYVVDDEVIKTVTQEYDTYIDLPKVFPLKQGYLFNWGDYPYKVPAHDVTIVGYYTEDTYECVDLGLPSGLLWATKNVGAANPENYGYFFSWGETILKESYYWGTYSYCNGAGTTLTKYCYSSDFGEVDNKETLDEEDDAVSTNWGKPWRLPTEAEAMELYENCTWALGNLNGTEGCYVTGPNGNSIFIPAAGAKQYMTTMYKGRDFYLLTSTLYKYDDDIHPDYGILIYCDGTTYGLSGEERSFGFSARPVTNIDPNGINNITFNNTNEIDGIFDLQGKRLPSVKKGINIIRTKDGRVKKIVAK